MKQLLRALALTLTLSAAVPAPVFAAAAAPRQDNPEYRLFGYAFLAIMAIGGLWWKFQGKKLSKEPVKQAPCAHCTQIFNEKDLITLHPHTTSFIKSAAPSFKSFTPEAQAREARIQSRRLKEVPRQKHRLCPACTISNFKLCIRNCQTVFEHSFSEPHQCNLALDIHWVDRNNPHMAKSIMKLCKKGIYTESADHLIKTWNTLCQDYPKMLAEFKKVKPDDHNTVINLCQKWADRWVSI